MELPAPPEAPSRQFMNFFNGWLTIAAALSAAGARYTKSVVSIFLALDRGGADARPALEEGRHPFAGEAIGALVLGVAGMALDP